MKAALVAVAALAAATVLFAPTSGAAAQRCSAPAHAARLTVRVLHMNDQPIGLRGCFLAKGPIWDPAHPARPGDGETMLVDGHDVTPVPGYGKHGPFYRLHLLRPGYIATITWKGTRYTYRVVTKPFAKRQCLSKRVNYLPARLAGELMCVANDKPVKSWNVESIYFRCCWPRYTREKFLYVRAVLIATTPLSR